MLWLIDDLRLKSDPRTCTDLQLTNGSTHGDGIDIDPEQRTHFLRYSGDGSNATRVIPDHGCVADPWVIRSINAVKQLPEQDVAVNPYVWRTALRLTHQTLAGWPGRHDVDEGDLALGVLSVILEPAAERVLNSSLISLHWLMLGDRTDSV